MYSRCADTKTVIFIIGWFHRVSQKKLQNFQQNFKNLKSFFFSYFFAALSRLVIVLTSSCTCLMGHPVIVFLKILRGV